MTTNTDAVPLKPCPFCGSSKVGMASEHDSDTGGVFLSVKCSGCRASSGAGFSTDPCPQTYQEVLDEWNRRAPTPAVQADGAASDGEQQFEDWFVKNYPGPDTIIHDPRWHAPKILRAARAAIAAGGAQEPIYQTCFIQGQWRDVDRAEYDRAKGLRADLARIVYAVPLPRVAATVAMTDQQREAIMEQAQVFASAWSLVGGRFDYGDALETAEQEKENLRALLAASNGVTEK